MRVSQRISGAVAVILLLSSARRVAAADVTPEAKAQAKDLDASAAKLAKGGATREAIAALRKSESLYPRPQTLRKIAEVERQNKDFAAAYDALGAVLSEFDSTLSPFDRKAIARSLAELAAITGTVSVKVVDSDTKIDIDGVPIGEGPLDKSVRVNLGSHVVHVDKASFLPFEEKVEVTATAPVQVTAVLAPKPGTLSIRVQGPSAHVRVDNVDLGLAPLEHEIAAGHHLVEMGEGPALVRKEVEVQPGARAEVELVYRPRARLEIRTEPTGAHVALDGESKGDAPVMLQAPAGRHELQLTLDGYEPSTETLELNGTESRSSVFNLTPIAVPPSFVGMYGQVNFAFLGSPSFDNTLTDICDQSPSACKGSTPDIGGSIPIRVGYSFGQFGIEGVSANRFDIGGRDIKAAARVSADIFYYGFTFVNGVAVRFMPETQGARFSMGLGIGWAHELMGVTASTHNIRINHPTPSGDAPVVLIDAAVLAGRTPGTKFRFGMEVQVQVNSSAGFVDPKFPDEVLARNAQVFLGPVFGAQFGH